MIAGRQEVAVIAGRLELLLLLFIVGHGKVVVTTHSGVATNSTCASSAPRSG